MKRILPTILIIAALAGCTRFSKTEYVTIEGDDLSRSTDSCEYFDVQWALFGRGNYAELRGEEINGSFCSTAFYLKDISMGPILPVIPLFGPAANESRYEKWLKIVNVSEYGQLTFMGLFSGKELISKIECCTTRYPGTRRDENEKKFIHNHGTVIPQGGGTYGLMSLHGMF